MEEIVIEAKGMRFPALAAGRGPLVVCLHGFPDCHRTWRHLLPALAEAGFRGVAPALRGYHPDCIPPRPSFHLSDLVDDVDHIIDALGGSAHLVGHDWGAAIVYGAAASAPDKVLSVCAAAVPPPLGMRRAWRLAPIQLRCSWYMFFFQLRGVADRVVEARDWSFIDKLWRDWSPGWDCPSDELSAVKQTLALPGVKASALGFYQAIFWPFGAAARRTKEIYDKRTPVRTLVMAGSDDGCMHPRFFRASVHPEDFEAELQVEIIEGTGHFLHLEDPVAFNRAVLGWLEQGLG